MKRLSEIDKDISIKHLERFLKIIYEKISEDTRFQCQLIRAVDKGCSAHTAVDDCDSGATRR